MFLLKYDLRGIYSLCFPAYLIGGIAMITNVVIGFLLFTFFPDFRYTDPHSMEYIAGSFLTMAHHCTNLGIGCILVATIGWTIIDFYRTVFGKVGYLTHTLPVTAQQILTSKIIASCVAFFSSIVAVYFFFFLQVLFNEDLREIWLVISWKSEFLDLLLPLSILLFFTLLLYLMLAFTAIALGHLTRHKVGWSVVFFILLYHILGNLPAFLTFIWAFSVDSFLFTAFTGFWSSFYRKLLFCYCGISGLICALCYFLIVTIMKKKLNLE